ncbi:MAG: ABC transporter permease [Firmicutes bacterium]|jgi:ribose transport system permease protein|nr:ABC transporter permease [Bacillota bacterium]
MNGIHVKTTRASLPKELSKICSSVLLNHTIWFVLAAMVLMTRAFAPDFLSKTNVMNMLREAVIVGILAIGMTFTIVSGCFDLSAGAIMGFCAVLTMTLIGNTVSSTLSAIVLPLIAGAAFGYVDGLLVGHLKMNGFITTLGMQYLILGITLLFTKGNYLFIRQSTPFFHQIGNGTIGAVPVPVLLMLGLAGVAQWVLSRTNFGQYAKASGANERAATLSGINVERVRTRSYVLLGICAAISGIVLASWLREMDPSTGVGYEFEAITAAVLGGTRLGGGRGNILNSIAGTLIMVMIVNAMILLNISYNYQLMVRGIILVAAVTLELRARRETN